MRHALAALTLLLTATAAHAQTSVIAFRNVTVVPATGGPSMPASTVLIRGDRIAAIGPVGVTTVRDTGGDYEELRRWRSEVATGNRVGPRILMPGPILESPANIARMRKDPPSERVEPFERMRIAVGRRFAAAGVPVVPTLAVGEAILTPLERLRAIVEDDAGTVEPRRRYLSKFLILDWREQFTEQSVEGQEQFRKFADQGALAVREMHEAGMDLLAGTDTGVINVYPGSSLHDELALFVKLVGMTPTEAIERGTRRSARFLRIGDAVGTIERGKIADLLMMDADPLLDITNTRRISAVFLRGQYYDREGLEKIGAQVRAAPDIRTDEWGRK